MGWAWLQMLVENITYLSGHVGARWQQEHVVDTVDDILRLNILLRLVLTAHGERSVHADVSDSLHCFRKLLTVIWQVLLQKVAATER